MLQRFKLRAFKSIMLVQQKRSDFEKMLDTIEPHQSFQVSPNYAQNWEEYLAHEAFHRTYQGEFAKELALDDTSEKFIATDPTWTKHSMVDEINDIFTLSSSVKITHLPEGLSAELESLLVKLPTNQVCVCPASLASKKFSKNFRISFAHQVLVKIRKSNLEFSLTQDAPLRLLGLNRISADKGPFQDHHDR